MDLIRKIFKGDKVIWMIFVFICVISIIEVFSAASTLTYKSNDHWSPIIQHSRYLLIGFLTMLCMQNIKYQWFKLFAYIVTPLAFVFLIWATAKGFISGDRVNGAARWISILGIQFQPSEVAKLGLLCTIAYVLSRYQKEKHADNKAFAIIAIIAGTLCLFIAIENFSTAALIGLVTLVMMYIGRIKISILLKSISIIALVSLSLIGSFYLAENTGLKVPAVFHRASTWVARLDNFGDANEKMPASKYVKDNPQRGHDNIAIASSHVIGTGPGNSVQRDFLSQAFSDFIYAIIIEELGLLGGGLVTLLYIWLLIRIGRIAKKCQDRFGMFLVIGIGLMLVSQAMVNMMVAVDLLPITGQPLPLISKGGSSAVINSVLLGMVLSVSHFTDLQIEQEEKLKLATTSDLNIDTEIKNLPQGPQTELLKDDDGFTEEETNI